MKDYREIPYNYTSADDKQVVTCILGKNSWETLEKLRTKRITGRSSRLLMRFIGDMFIIMRNPFLFQGLMDSKRKSRSFFQTVKNELDLIDHTAKDSSVKEIISLCRGRAKSLKQNISEVMKNRQKLQKKVGSFAGSDTVFFDPFTLISHATDATDWRLHLPLAVIRPDSELNVLNIMESIKKMGLSIIPRGAGTGLTGGAVPVRPDCVILNLEKLNQIHGITYHTLAKDDGTLVKHPVLNLEAGVITDQAMAYAGQHGLVFATDPTSSWASTIGGNLAENAGGKTAVLWGTAIDNIISYTICMPEGKRYTVNRTNHPARKILPSDTVNFDICDEAGKVVDKIILEGTDIRKSGLGKDITNKVLKGLPGIQKEGCDGVITSAAFILYPEYSYKKTFCLEFFGDDMKEASRVIVSLAGEFKSTEEGTLIALEHFDDAYVKAVNYKVKAARSENPKAVLLIDMVGHTEKEIDLGTGKLARLLSDYPNTSLFTARDKDEAERFWRDRKRLGAISSHTNAFKLNEDIVLPLAKLSEFSHFVDSHNMEEDRYNQKHVVLAFKDYLKRAVPIEDPDWLEAKLPKANELCDYALIALDIATGKTLNREQITGKLCRDLLILFRGFERISTNIKDILSDVRSRRIVLATHMHAGDGNVHVNIPVLSNDRNMMNRAQKSADEVMEKAVILGGVVSGEHGIGITKIKYLDSERIHDLNRYRNKVDPSRIMNPGKLDNPDILDHVFTPSFNLLGLEAKILQHSKLRDLALRIANCVRCGKCKVTCSTFYPSGNMFMHPRNKNLAIASLVEALLYDTQRSHSTRFKHLKSLEEIADHCNMCGKCFKPCPVDIDTSRVSILEREILKDRKFKHTSLPTRLSLSYLASQSRVYNALFREIVLKWGGGLQRKAHTLLSIAPDIKEVKRLKPFLLLKSSMPHTGKHTLRNILPACGKDEALMINPPGEIKNTVFYFPGCGSERLYSIISEAALFVLLQAGSRVILPPPYLCCGYPAKVNALKDQQNSIRLRNTIIFSQIREMLSYIEFSGCIVSCGTCRKSLEKAGTDQIFGCPVTDVTEFTLQNGLIKPDRFTNSQKKDILYHAPCHDSLGGKADYLYSTFAGYHLKQIPHCCSEAGTLALSRPDISDSMLARKKAAIKGMKQNNEKQEILLTNCPSCLSGLGRNRETGIIPQHMVVNLAIKKGGDTWKSGLIKQLSKAERVTF